MAKYKIQTDGEQYRVVEKVLFWWATVDEYAFDTYRNRKVVVRPMVFNSVESAQNWIDTSPEASPKPKWSDIDA